MAWFDVVVVLIPPFRTLLVAQSCASPALSVAAENGELGKWLPLRPHLCVWLRWGSADHKVANSRYVDDVGKSKKIVFETEPNLASGCCVWQCHVGMTRRRLKFVDKGVA